jgi:hypothetical protein
MPETVRLGDVLPTVIADLWARQDAPETDTEHDDDEQPAFDVSAA